MAADSPYEQPELTLDVGDVQPVAIATRPTNEVLVPPPVERIVAVGISLLVELTRLLVTFALLFILYQVVWFASHGPKWSDQQQWLQDVLPAISGLLGTAIGFYFGGTRAVAASSGASRKTDSP